LSRRSSGSRGLRRKSANVLNLVFIKGQLPPAVVTDLMNELSLFPGNFQRFTFRHLLMS
jgi:hypothetical protein